MDTSTKKSKVSLLPQKPTSTSGLSSSTKRSSVLRPSYAGIQNYAPRPPSSSGVPTSTAKSSSSSFPANAGTHFTPLPPRSPIPSSTSSRQNSASLRGSHGSRQPVQSRGLRQSHEEKPPERPLSSSLKKKEHERAKEHSISSQNKTETPNERPSSSFSKYKILPAIGNPALADHHAQTNPPATVYHAHPSKPNDKLSQATNGSQLKAKVQMRNKYQTSKQFKAPGDSDNSRPNSAEQNNPVATVPAESRTRSQIKDFKKSKNNEHWKVDRMLSNAGKPNKSSGCDRVGLDSGFAHSSAVHQPSKNSGSQKLESSPGEVKVSSEVILAVKLPTDGTRCDKNFNTQDTLSAIVQFAEEKAGRSFKGYVLVAAGAPKTVLVDLEDTIQNSGVVDKTVFHLEEFDWDD